MGQYHIEFNGDGLPIWPGFLDISHIKKIMADNLAVVT